MEVWRHEVQRYEGTEVWRYEVQRYGGTEVWRYEVQRYRGMRYRDPDTYHFVGECMSKVFTVHGDKF